MPVPRASIAILALAATLALSSQRVASASDGALPGPLLEPRSVAGLRAGTALQVDGVLDEPAWASAPVAERFIQELPTPGDPARLRTTFQVVFDDAARLLGRDR